MYCVSNSHILLLIQSPASGNFKRLLLRHMTKCNEAMQALESWFKFYIIVMSSTLLGCHWHWNVRIMRSYAEFVCFAASWVRLRRCGCPPNSWTIFFESTVRTGVLASLPFASCCISSHGARDLYDAIVDIPFFCRFISPIQTFQLKSIWVCLLATSSTTSWLVQLATSRLCIFRS